MKRYIKWGLIGTLLAAGVFFLVIAYWEHLPFAEAKEKQEALMDVVVAEDTPTTDPLMRQIDFETLKEINPDIIGWLYIPQIGVDLPILQGEDDKRYLNLDFEGNDSPLGSIFTWSDTDRKLSDMHICLFGHNMPSGQMFGNLHKFQDVNFIQEYGRFYLYTPKRTKELEVFSVYECEMTDGVFQNGWTNGHTGQIVTLAACTGYDITSRRLAVNSRVVRERLVL